MSDPDASARELLRDSFTRLIEHVDELTDGLTDDTANYRPGPDANSIAWLIWHSARVQDFQLAPIAGVEQVWIADGWVDRFGLDLPRNDTGFGHGPAEVAKVQAPIDLLVGYYQAVHKLTLEFVAGVTAEDLERIVDRNWDPPVTASARIVSIMSMQANAPRSSSTVSRTSPPSRTRTQCRFPTSAYQTAPSASMQMPSGWSPPTCAHVRRLVRSPVGPMS
jgi:hypothetical protein